MRNNKKDGKYVSMNYCNHLKSILNSKKGWTKFVIAFPIDSNCQQVSRFAPAKRKLSTMITKNRADFIITVTCFAKDELKGFEIHSVPSLFEFTGERLRLEPGATLPLL